MFPQTAPVDMFLMNRKKVDMFLTVFLRTGSSQWTSFREWTEGMSINFISTRQDEAKKMMERDDGHIS